MQKNYEEVYKTRSKQRVGKLFKLRSFIEGLLEKDAELAGLAQRKRKERLSKI
jgi:hypothetical protein